MILIMKILLHNEYKIINLWYPTYMYQFLNFPYNYKNRVLAGFQTRPRCCYQTQLVSHRKQQHSETVVQPKAFITCNKGTYLSYGKHVFSIK